MRAPEPRPKSKEVERALDGEDSEACVDAFLVIWDSTWRRQAGKERRGRRNIVDVIDPAVEYCVPKRMARSSCQTSASKTSRSRGAQSTSGAKLMVCPWSPLLLSHLAYSTAVAPGRPPHPLRGLILTL